MTLHKLALLLTSTLLMQAAVAQDLPAKKDSIYSNILQEQRMLQVVLPGNYDPKQKYDVLYVIDGEWNTLTFHNIRRYLQAIGFAPPAIVVGIPNAYKDNVNMRDRDFLPTSVKNTPFSGGAANFISFFKKELMPYINSTYHPGGESVLFGSSFGGTFTMYTLLTEPQLFKAYLCSDPAFWWDDLYLVKLAREKMSQLQLSGRMLYIGGRAGKAFTSMGMSAMDTVLRSLAPAGLAWKVTGYEDETHMSVTFKANYDALKFTYAGYSKDPLRFGLHGGISLPEQPVKVTMNTDHLDVRYTSDSSLPVKDWQRLDSGLMVIHPEKIVVRSFSPSGRYDTNIPLNIKVGKTIPPGKTKITPTTYSYYDLTDSASPKLVKTVVMTPSFKWMDTELKNYECVIEGPVMIPEKSYYVFQLDEGEGSEIYVNNTLWIKQPAGGKRQSIILPLDKGIYSLKMKLRPKAQFTVFQSKDGQDEWWNNQVYKE